MGCATAYHIIQSLDLKKYYEYCKQIYGVMPMKVNEVKTQLDYSEHTEVLQDGRYRLYLLVEGIHCGSCVWLIENALRKLDFIRKADVNLSTKRLVVEWEGRTEFINAAVEQIFSLGYRAIPFTPDITEREEALHQKDLLMRLAAAGFGSVAMMMIIWGVWAGNIDTSMGHYTRLLIHIFAGLIAIPIIFYSGMPFFRSAYVALCHKRLNMDVPISIGILGATLVSIHQMMLGTQYVYFDAAVSLSFFLLLGRYLDLKARNKARSFAHNLVLSQPKVITLATATGLLLVPLSKAKVGDVAFVSSGDKIAADGIVIEGETEIDTSLITGETMPRKAGVGDPVSAGTMNMGNPIKFRITALAEDTTLSEIIRLLEVAEQGRASYVRIADRVAQYFTPITLILSIGTFALWYWVWHSSLNDAILHSIALLIITCPCALGLAVPIVQVIASSRLMSLGILLKSEDGLERISQINHIVFDKTGTLTLGQPTLQNRKQIAEEDFAIIAALASHSKHVLCRGMHALTDVALLDSTPQELKGQGVVGYVGGEKVLLGSKSLCGVVEDSADSYMEMWFKHGGGKAIRLIFKDELRGDARSVVGSLRSLGIDVEILSGDRAEPVREIAQCLSVAGYKYEQTPMQKYQHLEQLAAAGKKVLMIGDGLNDAAALKAAHVSMSPANSLEIAQMSADIVFYGGNLEPVLHTYRIAKRSHKLVLQNFALSFLYNALTIPLAVAGHVTPIIAAIAMSASSIIVVLNSLRLR